MSKLKHFVPSMTNPELIGLAKNRYLDEEDQVAIAKFDYRRAHNYLMENSGLQPAARDILWKYKGYARKCELLAYGHYLGEDDKYHELYDNYSDQMRNRSPWRINRAFVRHHRWYSHGRSAGTNDTGCPPSILEDIYLKDVQRVRESENSNRGPQLGWRYYSSGPNVLERDIIMNPNTPLELIVKISAASEVPDNRQLAMKTMANRS